MKRVDLPEFLKIRKKTLFGVCSIQQFLRVRSKGDVMAELLEAGADMELQDKKGKIKASAVYRCSETLQPNLHDWF